MGLAGVEFRDPGGKIETSMPRDDDESPSAKGRRGEVPQQDLAVL